MKKPQTVKSLEEFGRVRLSKSFFMREFLYSEIS
ncbi:MAG: peptidase M15, partial [Cyanobacteria bacterium J06626_18]